jgi:uncharacterized phage protein (TIGR01671 family)
MIELKIRFVDTGDGTVYKPITLAELCQRIEIPRRIVLESENGDFIDTDDFIDQFEKGELIIEPYTGLKDKNSKEIYKGDIIDFFGEKYPVIYRAGGFWAEYSKTQKDHLFLYAIDSEVIGNIHENPELLETK